MVVRFLVTLKVYYPFLLRFIVSQTDLRCRFISFSVSMNQGQKDIKGNK